MNVYLTWYYSTLVKQGNCQQINYKCLMENIANATVYLH